MGARGGPRTQRKNIRESDFRQKQREEGKQRTLESANPKGCAISTALMKTRGLEADVFAIDPIGVPKDQI